MHNKLNLEQLAADNRDLRARLEHSEATLSEILSGEADALYVSGAGGAQIFTLKGADQSYRLLIENMSEGALTLTPEGLVLYANRRFAAMLRTSLESMIGSNIGNWIAAEKRQVLQALLQKDELDNHREELALSAADGTQVPVYLSVSRLILDEIDSVCMVVTDLTEQKRNEAILAAEKLSNAILEQAADTIVLCDENGRIMRASKQAQELCGKSPLGQPFEQAFALHRLDGTPCCDVSAINTSSSQSVEARLEHNGRAFDLLVSVGHLKGAGDELIGSVVTLTDITELKTTELALKKSELQLSEALTIARIGYWEYEYPTDEFVFNDQYYLLHKITAEEAGGYRMSSADFVSRYVYPEDAPMIACHVQAAFESRDPDYFARTETRILTGEGKIVWVEVSMRIQKDLQDNTIRIIGVNQDITERKKAELAIQEEMSFTENLIQSLPDIFFLLNDQAGLLRWNNRLEELFGLSQEAMLKTNAMAFIHDEDRQKVSGTLQQAFSTGSASVEARINLTNGLRDYLLTGNRIETKSGFNVIGLGFDITQRKHNELKLLESERRFTDLLGNVELVSMMLDREARITYCNDYLLRLTGWQREEVIGKNWWDLFVPPELHDMKGEFFAALLDNQPEALHHDNNIVTRSGERRLIRWNNSVLRSGTGEVSGTASIGEDISERKKAEARILYLNRVYAVLSGINTLIVHVLDRDELFREACNIAVEAGGFRMAVLVTMEGNPMQMASFASAGMDDELISAIKNLWSARAGMQSSIVARSIREKKAVVSNDVINDPEILLGRKYGEIGVHSFIVLPLIVAGEVAGAMALYAREIKFFQEDELKLLNELAGDIAYSIDHIEKQERLNYLAYYDVLTGLANRTLFLERVAQYIHSAVSGGHKLAIILIDVDRFKNINDSLGRPAGDALLKQFAEWLLLKTKDASLLARIDADHFGFVVPKVKTDGNLAQLAEKLMSALQEHRFTLNEVVLRISIKIGIAIFPDNGSDADSLFRNAEAALKNAKTSGERFLFYTQKMTAAVASKLTLENQLRQAIDNEEFVLYYQPKVNLLSGKVTGAEALIRWNNPKMGLVPPGEFIPILEETGMISEVGRWALRQAITESLRWRAAGLAAVRIAVNVSPLQLRNINFIDEIKQAIAIDAQAAAALELEITESVIMNNIEFNISSLQAIRAMGVTIAIDDFGTGFSSLSYLAKLPVDTLKIDRSFVIDMTAGPEGLALVSTIINLAHSLKLKVVAEGVESEEQLRVLGLLSCDEIQGFLFSKPVPAEIFETKFLAQLTPDKKE